MIELFKSVDTFVDKFPNIIELDALRNCLQEHRVDSPAQLAKVAHHYRGNFLRLLDELNGQRAKSLSVRQRFLSSAGRFFSNTNAKRLQDLPAVETMALEKAVINVLSQLAKDFPVNNEDPITLDEFGEKDVVFTSITGVRYLLIPLVTWMYHYNQGNFMYPNSASRMHDFDIGCINEECRLRKIPLKPIPKNVLRILEKEGFQIDLVGKIQAPEFQQNHIFLVKHLCNVFSLSEEAAIQEAQGLNYEQADALIVLYPNGLRGQHLRDMKLSANAFTSHHAAVLQDFLEKGLLVKDAIEKIDMDDVQQYYFMQRP